MQKVGPRSKLRFPALYLQQLAIPNVKHGLVSLHYLQEPLRLLPAGATVAGRGLNPLGDGTFSRRTWESRLVHHVMGLGIPTPRRSIYGDTDAPESFLQVERIQFASLVYYRKLGFLHIWQRCEERPDLVALEH